MSGGKGIVLPFILVTLIWSSTWIVIRDQLGSVPASWSVCYRFLLAGVAMAIFARLRGVPLNIGGRGMVFSVMGRAWCGESVCRYGLISVVAVLLKKKI